MAFDVIALLTVFYSGNIRSLVSARGSLYTRRKNGQAGKYVVQLVNRLPKKLQPYPEKLFRCEVEAWNALLLNFWESLIDPVDCLRSTVVCNVFLKGQPPRASDMVFLCTGY